MQAQQQNEAEDAAKSRNKCVDEEVSCAVAFRRKPEMQQSNKIHGAECEQSAEGNDLRRKLPRNRQHRDVGESSNNPLVVNRIATLRTEMAEDLFWNYVVASHAVEQARGANMSGQSAGQAGNQKHDSVDREQDWAADDAGHVHESSFGI